MGEKRYSISLIPTAQELRCYSKTALIGTIGSNLLLLAFLLGQPVAGLILGSDPCRQA